MSQLMDLIHLSKKKKKKKKKKTKKKIKKKKKKKKKNGKLCIKNKCLSDLLYC